MPRIKEFESVQISMRLREDQYRYLKHLARREAALKDEDITYSDLIRDAISEAYPVEEETEQEEN